MTCANCFHSTVCHTYNLKNDVSMCKQFISSRNVLYGSALKTVEESIETYKSYTKELEREALELEHRYDQLEHEVELLRIIKQTLEMQSGMKFNI